MKRLFFTFILCCVVACDDIIEVTDISNESVMVLAPKPDVALNDSEVTFTWEAVEEAEGYHLQIAMPNFEQAQQVLVDSTVMATFFSSTFHSGDYEWRVRAENSNYVTAYSVQGFSVSAEGPVDISNSQMVIVEPADNATFLTTDTVTFSWEALEGAEEYVVQIATPNFDNPTETITDETTMETTFSISELPENQYEFRVKGKNALYETGYAEISFTIN